MVNPLYRVPVIGPWARRVGQVENILSIPCATTPMMWVDGFFNAVPKALWSLYGPDCLDEVFARVGNPHHRRRRVKFHGITINSALGDELKLPGYGTWLFEAAEFAQRIGWYMMIIDATTQLAVDWTSSVYQYAGCQPGNDRWIKAINSGGLLLPTPAPNRILVGGVVEGDGRLLAPGGTGVLQLDSFDAGIAYAVKMSVWPLAGPPLPTIRPYILDSDGRQWAGKTVTHPDGSDSQTVSGFVKLPRPVYAEREFQLWCEVVGGYADCTGSYLALTATNIKSLFTSPCGKIKNRPWE